MNELSAGEYTRQVLELRAQRDYLEQRLRLQHDLHDAQADLVKLHRRRADELQPLVEEREQLLAAIPCAQGSVSQALKFLREVAANRRTHLRGVAMAEAERPKVGEREPLCVSQIYPTEDGQWVLRCVNCNVDVRRLDNDFSTDEPVRMKDVFAPDWAEHVRSKSPSDNLPAPAPEGLKVQEFSAAEKYEPKHGAAGMDPICSCGCDLCRRGAHCGGFHCRFGPEQSARVPNAANPNAGVKQAFPQGRWT